MPNKKKRNARHLHIAFIVTCMSVMIAAISYVDTINRFSSSPPNDVLQAQIFGGGRSSSSSSLPPDSCDPPENATAISFDGSNFIETELMRNFELYDEIPKTLSAWAKADTTNGGTVVWYGRSTVDNEYIQLGFRVVNSSLRASVRTSYSSAWDLDGSTTIIPGQWYHLTGVWEPDGKVKLYVNGQLDASSDGAGGSLNIPGGNQRITIAVGRRNTSTPGDYLQGAVTDAQVWDASFSPQDAQFAYDNPNVLVTSRPGTALRAADAFAIFEMKETDGTVVTDFTNRFNDGTMLSNNGQPIPITTVTQNKFPGRPALPNAGYVEEYYTDTGNPGADWKYAFERAQLAFETVYWPGNYVMDGLIRLYPKHRTYDGRGTGVIRQGESLAGTYKRMFYYNGPCAATPANSWDSEDVHFTNGTIDYFTQPTYGGFVRYSSIFTACGGGNLKNLSWTNLTFIDSIGTPHPGDSGDPSDRGDIWGIKVNPKGGTHEDIRIENNTHLARNMQFLDIVPDAGATMRNIDVLGNDVHYGRTIQYALLIDQFSSNVRYEDVTVKDNIGRNSYRWCFTFGSDSDNQSSGVTNLDYVDVLIENNQCIYDDSNAPRASQSPSGFSFHIGGDQASEVTNVDFLNNSTTDTAGRNAGGWSMKQYAYNGPAADILIDGDSGPKISMIDANMSGLVFNNVNFDEWRPRPEAFVFDGTQYAAPATPMSVTSGLDMTIFFQSLDMVADQYLAWGASDKYILLKADGSISMRSGIQTRTVIDPGTIEPFHPYELRLVETDSQGQPLLDGDWVTVYLNDELMPNNATNIGYSFFPTGPDILISSFGAAPNQTDVFPFKGRIHDIRINNASGPVASYGGIGNTWDDGVGNNDVIIAPLGGG